MRSFISVHGKEKYDPPPSYYQGLTRFLQVITISFFFIFSLLCPSLQLASAATGAIGADQITTPADSESSPENGSDPDREPVLPDRNAQHPSTEKGPDDGTISPTTTAQVPLRQASILPVDARDSANSATYPVDYAATDNVPVNSTTFPDPVFRAWVISEVGGGSTTLTPAQREAKTAVLVNEKGIASLEGIQYFPRLVSIQCYGNAITMLEISHATTLQGIEYLTELTALECKAQKLTALDLRSNVKLTKLNCADNQIASLDVSMLPKLITLDARNNKLAALDVGKNPFLKELNCGENVAIDTLDISKNPALETLYCYAAGLTVLDTSSNSKLNTLSCYENSILSLDIADNPELIRLYCNDMQLTALDTTNNTVITTFNTAPNNTRSTAATLVEGAWQADLGAVVGTGNAGNISLSSSSGIDAFDPTTGLIVFGETASFPFAVEYRYATEAATTRATSRILPVTLTVTKDAGDTYTVTFDADGGLSVPATQTVADGAVAAKPTDPVKNGFTFDGWFAQGETAAWDFGTAVTGDITLIASWKLPVRLTLLIPLIQHRRSNQPKNPTQAGLMASILPLHLKIYRPAA